jgi:hypothetical protein
VSAMAFFVMPTAAILSVTGQDVVVILLGEKWRQSGLLLSIMAWGRVLKPEKASDTLGLALPDEGGGSCILRDEEREHLAAETLVEREVTADCDDLVIGMGPRLIHADSQLHGG